ncbi:MAG: cysteine desulfurase [Planctomycetaceae bacterium]|nr:MAG: cysteine desulfurase [Planctomycetaceae bacterium]
MIYLDNNATTAIDPLVADAIRRVWDLGPLNPSSQHRIGRLARNLLDEAISRLGKALGADVDSPGGDSLVLTSGGTESNQLALQGLGDPDGPLVISQIEHPSVLEPARAAASAGRTVRVIPVDADGRIDLPAARRFIVEAAPRAALVSVMSANNETGVIQPIDELARICQEAGVPLHVDATQTVGKLPFDFGRSGVTAITAAAHKFHGPAGVGLLLVRSGVELRPMFRGGEQQLALRAGTEPVALAVGMAEALVLAAAHFETTSRLEALRVRLETGLLASFSELVIHGRDCPRLPGTSCLSFPGADRQAMLMALDMAGVACSSGSACASGSSRPSHVLAAMGVPDSQIDTALRFGFSRFSSLEDCERAIERISRQYQRLRDRAEVPVENLSISLDRDPSQT